MRIIFLEHSKAPPKFDHPFWNDVTYSDEYVLYADLLPVCDGIFNRNITTVLPSVCNAKKKAQKIVSKFSRKTPNFFDEWKAYLEINFFSFSLISDWFVVNIWPFAQFRSKSRWVPPTNIMEIQRSSGYLGSRAD